MVLRATYSEQKQNQTLTRFCFIVPPSENIIFWGIRASGRIESMHPITFLKFFFSFRPLDSLEKSVPSS